MAKNKEEKRVQNISIENAEIIFPNFSGKEGVYNPPGKRNFCVKLDPELADMLKADGWNVKMAKPKNPEQELEPLYYLQVAVAFGDYPPKIILITSHGKTKLTEEDVNTLDFADIASADIIINPYNYEVRGTKGIKAYLRALYVTIKEDEFESKYYDVPDSAENTIHCEHCNGCGDCQRAGEQ